MKKSSRKSYKRTTIGFACSTLILVVATWVFAVNSQPFAIKVVSAKTSGVEGDVNIAIEFENRTNLPIQVRIESGRISGLGYIDQRSKIIGLFARNSVSLDKVRFVEIKPNSTEVISDSALFTSHEGEIVAFWDPPETNSRIEKIRRDFAVFIDPDHFEKFHLFGSLRSNTTSREKFAAWIWPGAAESIVSEPFVISP